MQLTTTIAAGTAVLAVAGGLWATQAYADPTTPAPESTASARPSGAAVGPYYRALTDEQRQCLVQAHVQRPDGRLTDEETQQLREQVRAALESCGITVPERAAERPRLGFGWASLTEEQQQCLADQELTRPVGRLTEEQREAVRTSMRQAAESCGLR